MPPSDNRPASKKTRGFASMSPEKRREIATRGGKSVPGEKRAFAVDRTLAAAAGRKGGAVSPLADHISDGDKSLSTQDGWIGLRAKTAK